MSIPIIASTQELAEHINEHLGELVEKNPAWRVADSPISGRGIFASRDITPGEIILRERAIVTGPTANKSSNHNTCCVCHCRLDGSSDQDIMCKNGCTLPVCEKCTTSELHSMECELFCKWKPKDPTKINPNAVRMVSVVRCFHLKQLQRKLLYALQANRDKYYMLEMQRASDCFESFPKEQDMLNYIYRTVCTFNTNAFEGTSSVGGHDVLIRFLFPLAGLLNHQCTPNVNHHFENGDTIVITAACPILKGEEILTTYTKLLWSTLSRKVFLAMTKKFMCICPRCMDPTENGTHLSALFCREKDCKGIVIPVQTKTMQPDWRCLTCASVFPHSKMARYQDFALNTINNRINVSSVSDMITFINEMCPRFCPSSNYVLVEAKLNVIWRMSKMNPEEYTEEQLKYRDQYKQEILDLLEKLGAGDCTLRKLITEQIQ